MSKLMSGAVTGVSSCRDCKGTTHAEERLEAQREVLPAQKEGEGEKKRINNEDRRQ